MRKLSLLPLAFAGALLLTGCNSINSMEYRAARYPQTWAKLTPADQERVRRGEFKPGDPIQLVYIRYGTPDEVRRSFNAAGQTLDMWTWQMPGPVDAVTTHWLVGSRDSGAIAPRDYGVMSAGMPAKTSEQVNAEYVAAVRLQQSQPDVSSTPRAASWGGGRIPPGPFLFENGVLVPSAHEYGQIDEHAKVKLPQREKRDPGQVSS
jgi:hypothetical protein